MAEIKDLVGLEKPLIKLVETISEGVGVVGNAIFEFDAKKIKRTSEAEAEAEKQKIIKKAEGQEEALMVLSRASKRFALEQYNRQINLENIIFKSKEYLLGQEVSEEPVDKDWTSRFIGVAQEISREEVQDLLAQILAGEIKKPGSYSLRTLEILKNLSKDELESFCRFVALSCHIGFFHLGYNFSDERLKKYDLIFGEFIHLSEIGLFYSSESLVIKMGIEKGIIVSISDSTFLITAKQDQKEIALGIIKFTDVGAQIFELLKDRAVNNKEKEYFKDFKIHVESKGFNTSCIKGQ